MSTEKTNDELARELRVKLVREVAVLASQADALCKRASCLGNNLSGIDQAKKKFLESLGAECIGFIEKKMLGISFMEIEDKYINYIEESAESYARDKKEIAELTEEFTILNRRADDARQLISQDVLVEKYGRGELILRPEGLRRIVGRITYLNESTDPVYGIVLGKSDKIKASISEIAWLCENSDQHPPLFFVDIDLMPLNEEELKKICWENHDYKLLVKNIPEDQIVWNTDWVCCLNKNLSYEVYVIPRSDEHMFIVKIEKFAYPYWKVEVLGRAVRSKESLKILMDWAGYNKAPIELEEVPNENNWNLNIMEWYLFKRYPGIILEMPQWEGERLSMPGT